MKLRWTARATEDLLEIGRFIGRDDPVAARRWVERLRKCARDAARAPRAGRLVPELGRADVREVLFRGYRLAYRVRAAQVEILTVFEGHRRFPRGAVDEPEA